VAYRGSKWSGACSQRDVQLSAGSQQDGKEDRQQDERQVGGSVPLMDDEIIDDIADSFAARLNLVLTFPLHEQETVRQAILDDIEAMACVINDHQKTYDLRYFYNRSNYPVPYPVHPMR
jgi:hypothetical protein